ncbi:MAG: UDP-N-acetylglucosamine acyltransferase [Alphaproteobacteria bacterium]|nr:UDP-N-acetylglucosamine acyltransferase [Alphaproteobacteria bacterium]
MNFFKTSIVVFVGFLTCACQTVPPLDFTVPEVGRVAQRKPAEAVSTTIGFAPQTQQRRMETDSTLPPIWKEALTDAINRSLIFTDGANTKVNISVRIVEINAPEIGIDMKSTVAAIYEIVDRRTGDLILTEEIATVGVVPGNYAFDGRVRARESVNRAVRNNIAGFIALLERTDFSRPAFPAS